MTPELIAAIQTFTLNSRKLLERETEEQLQGLYGWLTDGTFGIGTALGLPEAVETRARLERYVAEERDAGLDAAAARARLKRETAFTWLNRVVAFRLMEERNIIRSTFGKLQRANAFIYYLTEVLGETSIPASTPINAMNEGPADTAYRQFLLWQCGQLSEAVSVLFDPGTLASRFCPRPAVLKTLAETMNAADLADAWKAGNEETVGWVYQGFNAEELQAAFAAARESKTKFEPQDIPAVTQLFTIRWVVRFLVENTLGRLWVEMHPDSRLASSLAYLVPVAQPQRRPVRPIREITFLDPCCGSMHFGLLAFDLFAEMYREERENAGRPGWPATPSAVSEEEIPELILSHNIHGIDIDTRAIQLSALTLILRARTLKPKTAATAVNLASANVEQITSGRLEEFVTQARFSHPIYERILRRLATRLKDSDQLGSLLRIERDIRQLVDEERRRSTDLLGQLPGLHPEQFNTQDGVEEFFGILTDQILQHLDHFVKATHQQGKDAGLFAGEAAKGLRFLRIAEQRYDVVVTNPPYLSGRKMNKRLATLMQQEYNEGKGDLYAAFIMRCEEFLATDGLMGMLTMHSFMFISSYENLRGRLRKEIAIEALAHFGGGLFAVGNPGTLQTAAFILRREPEPKRREVQVGTYFRLVKERDADAKRFAFESAVAALRQGTNHLRVFHCQQADFDSIPEEPWVYWMPKSIRKLFGQLATIGETAKPRVGLQTGHNERFMRKWWEVGYTHVSRRTITTNSNDVNIWKWFPYNKGGPPIAWHSKQQNVVNWSRDGAEIRSLGVESGKIASRPQNTEYYFRRGVTWSLTTMKAFAARLSPAGFIFDVNGMTCFPPDDFNSTVLGLLNSRTARFILSAISPTIAFQVGDIERLPVPKNHSPVIDDLVNQCVEIAQADSSENETTYDFVQPLRAMRDRAARQEKLATLEIEIDNEVSRLYGLNDEELNSIESELDSPAADGDDDTEVETEPTDEDETEVADNLSPADWARSWISYALGTVLGRFEIGLFGSPGSGDFAEATATQIRSFIDLDGIMPCEPGHPQDLAARAFACLELMLGSGPARDAVFSATFTAGDPVEALRGWLDRFAGTPAASFWKYHHPLYRKRPVYWPFQSPRKTYTVWVFHEKLGPNTLHTIKEFVDVRLNLLERSEIPPLRFAAATNRAKERELQKLLEQSDDLREFSARLQAHIESGYQSCIDDGVLLNAAPLHDLFPSWPDTKKAWEELKAGKYDWAQQAMRYWPERVTAACRTNRSFAIAHGREDLCPAAPARTARSRGRQPADLTDIV